MESGARGCHVVISGKLTGERHRTEKFKEGYIKFCGEPKLKFIRQGFAVAKLKPGVIGVKVEIMAPDARLPDEVDIVSMEEALKIAPELADLINPKQESALAEAIKTGEPSEAPAEEPKPETKVEENREPSSSGHKEVSS